MKSKENDGLVLLLEQCKETRGSFQSAMMTKACECEEISCCLKNLSSMVSGSKILSETVRCPIRSSREVLQSGLQDYAEAGQVCPSVQEGVHHFQKTCETVIADDSAEEVRTASQRDSVVLCRQHTSVDLDSSFQKEQSGMAGKLEAPLEKSEIGLEDRDLKHREDLLPKSAVHDKSGLGVRQAGSVKRKIPEVIIIEDDDKDGEIKDHDSFNEVECCDEQFDSDAGSRRFPGCQSSPTGWQSPDDSSVAASELSESSDEDDCLVMEPGPSRVSWHVHKSGYRSEKRPAFNLFNSSGVRRSSSNSSDCEIIEDPFGKARQDWEEAALRKRLGNALNSGRYRAESEGSTSASNPANSAAKRSTNVEHKGDAQQNRATEQEQSKTHQSCPSIPMASASFKYSHEREAVPVGFDQQDSNHECPDERPEDEMTLAGEETSIAGNTSDSSGNEAESFDERASDFHSSTPIVETIGDSFSEMSAPLEDCDVPQASERLSDDHIPQRKADEAIENLVCESIVVDRERLKETEEFRHAEEEEWARRQLELQRQAQEAQRNRKRRKVEVERRLEMESRQRQRLEEIRRSQQKEEQNLGYKEQVRGRIRSELERVAAPCVDMATLLDRLGIQVEGGSFPTTQQVNAAYKRALLRFHPDRVAAMAKSDPSHQVEAEETFKLISRMKSTLQPVAIRRFT